MPGMSKSNGGGFFAEVNEAVISNGGLRRHEGSIKYQPIFLVVMYDKALWCEHEVGDERCEPCWKGEYMHFVIFLVHGNHDLGHSHINGFVVTIFVEFLELFIGAQGMEGGGGAICEDALEMDSIISGDEGGDAGQYDVWVLMSSTCNVFTAYVAMNCCKIAIEMQ